MIKLDFRNAVLLTLSAVLLSCQQQRADTDTISFTVKNELDLNRRETVSIPAEKLHELMDKYGAEKLLVRDVATDSLLVTQALDADGDGTIDELLFQTAIPVKATKEFLVEGAENGAAIRLDSRLTTYSRFVPERTDDYTWENDRVAFRTYGPEAQRLVEEGEPGGTLSSGIDAWLKRVDYPIIDKWYKNHQEQPGAYHIDSGEGYDPYHVGASRGIGGIGVWENDSIYVSGNFQGYKTIATGPIRTVFELTYAPWQANGRTIQETKRISLDLGSNLSRFDVTLTSDQPLPNAAVGLTLHDKKGEVKTDAGQGWFRYWEPMDDSELGEGLVMDPEMVKEVKDRRTETPDQSHILVLTDASDKFTYYAGFGWKKSGHFASSEEWDQYLANYARRIKSPLVVKF